MKTDSVFDRIMASLPVIIGHRLLNHKEKTMADRQSLLAFHEGRRARKLGQSGSLPEPWRWFPLSLSWIRGWNAADAAARAGG
jgi:hypothetical protein